MPLPTLNWRAVSPASITLGTTAGVLDALYTIGQSATYSDGSARTPGSGSAWTWNRQQVAGTTEACWGVPPTNTLNCGYIVAGSATAGLTPQMNSTENAYTANLIMVAMNKNSGSPVSFPNSWTIASPNSPFGAGQFSGYVSGGLGTSNGTLYYWESQESFICQLVLTGGGSSHAFGAGAFIDPMNASAANCETDGRIYSIMTTGGGRTWATNWTQTYLAAGYGPFKGRPSSATSNSRFASFAPGAATSNVGVIQMLSITDVSWLSPGGEVPLYPVNITTTAAAGFLAGTPILGDLRSLYFIRSALAGQVVSNAGVVKGYVLAPITTGANGALLMTY